MYLSLGDGAETKSNSYTRFCPKISVIPRVVGAMSVAPVSIFFLLRTVNATIVWRFENHSLTFDGILLVFALNITPVLLGKSLKRREIC